MGNGEGQGSLECCSPWGFRESEKTQWLNSNNEASTLQGRDSKLNFHRGYSQSPKRDKKSHVKQSHMDGEIQWPPPIIHPALAEISNLLKRAKNTHSKNRLACLKDSLMEKKEGAFLPASVWKHANNTRNIYVLKVW